MISSESNRFMREAIRLASENVRKGLGGPFGAVIVKDGKIISTGVNSVTKDNDPTAHAEINAIKEACRVLSSYQLDGCDIYTSCEPCPMCLGAIYWARPSRLYFAATKQDAASVHFDDQFIYNEIALPHVSRSLPTQQMMRDEAMESFRLWESSEVKKQY